MAKTMPLVQHPGHSIEAHIENGMMKLLIQGNINEDLNFGSFFKLLNDLQLAEKAQNIAFDLSKVTRINSCGVREWLLFVERAQAVKPIRFSALSEIFLSQASMVPNMLGRPGTPVDTFEAPYYCEKCATRHLKVFKATDIPKAGNQYEAPSVKCPKCNSELEFDSLPSGYFDFLRHASKV